MSRDSKDAARVKKVLDECLKQPENKVCCECGMKQPRWASTNLGCFMCIRCSGAHRNLGTHISKVKSVSLDSWPLEQAEFMASMGNEKANAVWEHSMPANRKPNENDTTYLIEQFIKDKSDGERAAGSRQRPLTPPASTAASPPLPCALLSDTSVLQ